MDPRTPSAETLLDEVKMLLNLPGDATAEQVVVAIVDLQVVADKAAGSAQ